MFNFRHIGWKSVFSVILAFTAVFVLLISSACQSSDMEVDSMTATEVMKNPGSSDSSVDGGKNDFSTVSITSSDVPSESVSDDSIDTTESKDGNESNNSNNSKDNNSTVFNESKTDPSPSETSDETSKGDQSGTTNIASGYMRGIWISQYDMNPVYVDSGIQREIGSYTSMVKKIISNIKKDGFNTVFLQIRPFGDSFYESDFYPVSLFVRGSAGTGIFYDPIEIFIREASSAGIEVHAWINPYRLMLKTEIASVPDKFLIKKWYNAGGDRIIEVSGRLYLNPAYPEAIKLICDGAAEILRKYNVAGIHIDDYFYPTTDPSFDAKAFEKSGFTSLSAFRENNVSKMVASLYDTVKKTHSSAVFGVSPAGNLSSLRSVHYADVEKWCSSVGYLDYVIPQVYFGFLHGVCPFDKTTDEWVKAVKNPKVKLYIGLSGGNAYNAYNGDICVWASTEEGKKEWINKKDVLKRSFEYIFTNDNIDGYVFFCYQYLYNPRTGLPTPNLATEYKNFISVIKKHK